MCAHPVRLSKRLDRPRRHVISRAHGGQGGYARRGRGERLGRGARHQARGNAASEHFGAVATVSRRTGRAAAGNLRTGRGRGESGGEFKSPTCTAHDLGRSFSCSRSTAAPSTAGATYSLTSTSISSRAGKYTPDAFFANGSHISNIISRGSSRRLVLSRSSLASVLHIHPQRLRRA
jgi:hypothetical protein